MDVLPKIDGEAIERLSSRADEGDRRYAGSLWVSAHQRTAVLAPR